MITAELIRKNSTVAGTLGRLTTSTGYSCYSLECPDMGNIPNVSCIPVGVYSVELKQSDKYSTVYEIQDVPGRTSILIHPGNWAGNTNKGYKSDSKGCILLGMGRAHDMAYQLAIRDSVRAVKGLTKSTGGEPFVLTIR